MRMAPTHPHPHNPDEGSAEVISDAFAAVRDRIENLFRRKH